MIAVQTTDALSGHRVRPVPDFRPRRVTTGRCSRPRDARSGRDLPLALFGLSAVVRRAGNPGDVRQGRRLPVADTGLRGADRSGHRLRRQEGPRLQQLVRRTAPVRPHLR